MKSALDQMNRQWHVTLANIRDAIITTDSQSRIRFINRKAEFLTGWTQEEAQGQLLSEIFRIINEQTPQLAENRAVSALQEKTAVESVSPRILLAKDGREIPIDNKRLPIRDEREQMLGTVLIFHEATEQEYAKNQTKVSNRLDRSIIESSPDCIQVLELDGTLRSVNSLGTRFMEFDDLTPYLGKQWVDFWEEKDRDAAHKALETARHSGMGHFEGFCKSIKGTPQWWDVSISLVPSIDGNPAQLVATSRDITERKQIEAERKQMFQREQAARREAEDANHLKDEFVATISHELRAPLNAILGWARLLRAGRLDQETAAKAIETIGRSAENQARLIDDLLDISRLVTGKLRLEVRTIDPLSFVRSALETVIPAAEAKGITLTTDFDPATSFISGDTNRLQQVVWNLLSNAIKFTPRGGAITLRLTHDESQVSIIVSDTGQGISSEFLPYVFDRFRQADSSSIRRHGGLGLGLALVRHLVEMHGGSVTAESAGVEQGATFTVKLPITPPRVSVLPIGTMHDSNKQPLKAAPMLDGLLILVVDDEEEARQLLMQMLSGYGATVVTAGSAAEALEVLKQQQPDVMISDIGMPGENGYTLMRQVRSLKLGSQGRLPAIALTAYAQDRVRALAAGFQYHVPKPVEPIELATVVASLTGRLISND